MPFGEEKLKFKMHWFKFFYCFLLSLSSSRTAAMKVEHVKEDLVSKRDTGGSPTRSTAIIDISSSDSDSSSSGGKTARKKKRFTENNVLPLGFLDPLPSNDEFPSAAANANANAAPDLARQFWKAGDYDDDDDASGDWKYHTGGMDHVRVHPRFLHSNATCHKWVLGAFAELLDNSLDEVRNGATYVSIDMVESARDGSKMLLIEDNGGGMDPDKMRHCMSLGYSAKGKMVDTLGQYGNGFKTSTMRLGADAIVFSRCHNELRSTQSIGLLSYTFLRSTRKEDTIVPMLDYERRGQDWSKIIRSSPSDWDRNVARILNWSPFSTEIDLLQQFNLMEDQGTRIMIYNLWENDEGMLELDFVTDPHDIQIRGFNEHERSIEMARKYPNSKHFLTYRHSLRSYAAILYLRIPPGFRIILRGQDIEHHNIVKDMMMYEETSYRPHPHADGPSKNLNMVATLTLGFAKDAEASIDVQGFNVYYKNRLIKPFWRVWHPRRDCGIIGLLEADYIEPTHDKQDFQRTTLFTRLETRLMQLQKAYWSSNCHKLGNTPRRKKNAHGKGNVKGLSCSNEATRYSAEAGNSKLRLAERLREEEETNFNILNDLEKEKEISKSLKTQLEEALKQVEELRQQLDMDEENRRIKVQEEITEKLLGILKSPQATSDRFPADKEKKRKHSTEEVNDDRSEPSRREDDEDDDDDSGEERDEDKHTSRTVEKSTADKKNPANALNASSNKSSSSTSKNGAANSEPKTKPKETPELKGEALKKDKGEGKRSKRPITRRNAMNIY